MADHGHRHALLDAAALDTEERTGQGLGKGRAARRQRWAQAHDVGGNQPRREREVFSVAAVDEEEVLAQVLAPRPAAATGAAGRGVGGDHAVPFPEARHAPAQARDGAGELMAEHGRHVWDHHGVSAAQHLDVGAAGQRGLDPDDDLAQRRLGHRHLLEAEIPRPIEDLSFHGVM